MTALLRSENGQYSLNDPQCTEEVGLHLRPGLFLGYLFDRSNEAVAGIIDHDVESPEMLVSLFNGGIHGSPVGDIQPKRHYRAAESLGEGGETVDVTGGCGDFIPSLQCRLGPYSAEASRGSRDKPDFF